MTRIRHRQAKRSEKPSNSDRIQDVQALWESANSPQYPPGTVRKAGAPSSRHIIWDSTPKSLLKQIHHSHPAYRTSTLVCVGYVPRETPDTARAWYAPPLNPSECQYKRMSTHSEFTICEVTHLPSGLTQVVKGKGSWVRIRQTAEYRLSGQLTASGVTCERDRWLKQVKKKKEQSDLEESRLIRVYANMITKRWKKHGNAAEK